MPATTTTSLGLRTLPGGAVAIIDSSCGACEPCREGGPLWCLTPTGERGLGLVAPSAHAELLRDALLCAAAVEEALLLTAGPDPLLLTGAGAHAVRALLADDLEPIVADRPEFEVRELVAARHESARAGLIATMDDLRHAVKAVRRGSTVVGVPGAALPSVTEVVQREVLIVVPRSIDDLAERVRGRQWNNAIAALDAAAAA